MSGIPSQSIILMEDIDAAFTHSINRDAPPSVPSSAVQPSMTMPTSGLTLSGLLNAIDGVQAQQGRLLFATTNKYDALDPALVRPGRLDLHVEFKRATKWQAEELFKRFYPVEEDGADSVETRRASQRESDPDTTTGGGSAEKPEAVDYEQEVKDLMKGAGAKQRGRKAPRLSPDQLDVLAREFSEAIPEYELSMAYVHFCL